MNYKTSILFALTSIVFGATSAHALIRVLPSRANVPNIRSTAIVSQVKKVFNENDFREIRVQVIAKDNKPDHLLVYLFSKKFHRVDFEAVKMNEQLQLSTVQHHYQLLELDRAQQMFEPGAKPKCPDKSVEFIAFCPNDDSLELNITNEVAQAAQAKGLKTVTLLKEKATAKAYMNYMSCPNLKGNFYDGDANTSELATNDGVISAETFKNTLKNAFRYKVTNIWLACEAFNDPMLGSVRDSDQSQKYAAGINDLEVGPSDEAAACAMKAALDGKPMTASFQDCYQKLDTPDDQWGFDGKGSDLFGQ